MALMEDGFMTDSKDLANIVVNGSCGMEWALIIQEVILTMEVTMGAIRWCQEDQAITMATIMEATKQYQGITITKDTLDTLWHQCQVK